MIMPKFDFEEKIIRASNMSLPTSDFFRLITSHHNFEQYINRLLVARNEL